MGSFANSLHVRSNDSRAVADAIQTILAEYGYSATDEQPDEDAIWSMASSPRAVQVSESRDGWVAVLDSDLMNMPELAAELSRHLQTHAIVFMVNDSDSWHYQLFHAGEDLDVFDSSGEAVEEEDESELPESRGFGIFDGEPADETDLDGVELEDENEDDSDLNEFVVEEEDFEQLPAALQDRVRQLAQTIEDAMPAEIRDLQEQINRGEANSDAIQQYSDWLNAQMPQMMDEMQDLIGSLPDVPIEPHSEACLREHVACLRPLIGAHLDDELLFEVMSKQATFAEQTLGEFLTLLGIAPAYADLSYVYARDYTEAELTDASVRFVEHLKFKIGE